MYSIFCPKKVVTVPVIAPTYYLHKKFPQWESKRGSLIKNQKRFLIQG